MKELIFMLSYYGVVWYFFHIGARMIGDWLDMQ